MRPAIPAVMGRNIFTEAPERSGALGKQPDITPMDQTITSGSWKGHLGRGLAPRELQFLLWVALGFTAKEIRRPP